MSRPEFHAIVALSALVDAGAAGWALFARRGRGEEVRPGTIHLARVAGATAAIGAAFAIKAPILALIGVRGFGLMRLAYVDLVVVAPLIGLAMLTTAKLRLRQLTTPAGLAAWAALAMAGVGVYATEIEPYRLRLETASVPVPSRREGGGVVRIGVMTDLQTDHVTDYERGAVERLMARTPDVILLPGDVFQGPDEDFDRERPALRDLLARLSAPGGVFLVPGDVDPPRRASRLVEGTRIAPLVDEIATITVGDRRLTIGGMELEPTSEGARRVIRRLETAGGDDDIRILLAHRPDAALALRPGSRIDLVVAGHTHGGQVVLPIFGPPITLSRVPRAVAAGGLHAIRGNAIYVSRGIGCERGQAPRLRFLCPPEISLLTLGEAEAGAQ